ncbi:hypothetical protein VP01_1396g1 [Puccinia sorghi]|uniref:Uncharacterized protein n=1 Tax=Puccinia sorghi TaxID=27349 RepID=A0A0L6VL83_9BASI|nr:hypothetical protein VP01_1396g1 [Puccinia sorghi]
MSCPYFLIQGILRIPLYESLRFVMIMLSGVGLCSSLRLILYAPEQCNFLKKRLDCQLPCGQSTSPNIVDINATNYFNCLFLIAFLFPLFFSLSAHIKAFFWPGSIINNNPNEMKMAGYSALRCPTTSKGLSLRVHPGHPRATTTRAPPTPEARAGCRADPPTNPSRLSTHTSQLSHPSHPLIHLLEKKKKQVIANDRLGTKGQSIRLWICLFFWLAADVWPWIIKSESSAGESLLGFFGVRACIRSPYKTKMIQSEISRKLSRHKPVLDMKNRTLITMIVVWFIRSDSRERKYTCSAPSDALTNPPSPVRNREFKNHITLSDYEINDGQASYIHIYIKRQARWTMLIQCHPRDKVQGLRIPVTLIVDIIRNTRTTFFHVCSLKNIKIFSIWHIMCYSMISSQLTEPWRVLLDSLSPTVGPELSEVGIRNAAHPSAYWPAQVTIYIRDEARVANNRAKHTGSRRLTNLKAWVGHGFRREVRVYPTNMLSSENTMASLEKEKQSSGDFRLVFQAESRLIMSSMLAGDRSSRQVRALSG